MHDTTSQLKVSFFVNQQLNTRPQRRKICNNHILTGRVDIAVFSHTVLFESVIMELATGNRHKGHLSCQLSTVRGDAFATPQNMAELHSIMHGPTHVQQSWSKAEYAYFFRNDLENLFLSNIEKEGYVHLSPSPTLESRHTWLMSTYSRKPQRFKEHAKGTSWSLRGVLPRMALFCQRNSPQRVYFQSDFERVGKFVI